MPRHGFGPAWGGGRRQAPWAPGMGAGHGRGMGRGSLLEPALLASLAAQATHGYDLKKTIESLSGGFLVVDPGGLYRALRRLEEDGFVESAWASGDFGPQRREYKLTSAGAELLEEWVLHLRQRRDVIGSLIEALEKARAGVQARDEKDNPGEREERKKNDA
jgi:PadR family transcriptional regulator PadR